MTYLSAFVGDFRVLTIPLTKNGVAYAPGNGSAHIFTIKDSVNDQDADAIIQKATGAGLEIDGTDALVTLLREDTENLTIANKNGRTFVFDVLELIDGVAELPNAEGIFTLKQRVTREQQTSIPVITTAPPLPFGATLSDLLTALGITSYATLTAANTALPIGTPFFNEATGSLAITTA